MNLKLEETAGLTMTLFKRVSDGDRSASLSFLSCGAFQSDEIIGILKVLFRYIGNGTRLALTITEWLTTREAVVLVPDPIIFKPVESPIVTMSASSSSTTWASLVSPVKTHPHHFAL